MFFSWVILELDRCLSIPPCPVSVPFEFCRKLIEFFCLYVFYPLEKRVYLHGVTGQVIGSLWSFKHSLIFPLSCIVLGYI